MSGLRNGNLQDNEIVKASDVQLIGDGGIENLGKTFKTLFGNTKSVIVGGKLTSYNTETGLQAKLSPIMGVHKDNTDIFCDNEGKFYLVGDTEIADTISFVNADSSDRRDIVEVKASEITAVENSRQFYDPETETTSYSQTNTEKRHILVLKVKKGTVGSDTAPETDEGYVKIAEVVIPADATSLEDSNIYNVTADIDGMDNVGWTSEKQVTINPGSLQAITDKFRKVHEIDGTLKDNVISAAKLILNGIGALKGDAIQKGEIPFSLGELNVQSTDSIATVFSSFKSFLTPNSNNIKATVFDTIYPVGFILTTTDATNPGTVYGGSWEAYGAGRVLVGVGTGTDTNNTQKTFAVGNTGGEYTHTITTAELASHNHSMPLHTHTLNSHSHSFLPSGSISHVPLTGDFNPSQPDGDGPLWFAQATNGTYTATGVFSFASTTQTGKCINETATNFSKGHKLHFDGSHSHTFTGTTGVTGANNGNTGSTSGTCGSTGSGTAHNNTQPYVAVYMWRRTA